MFFCKKCLYCKRYVEPIAYTGTLWLHRSVCSRQELLRNKSIDYRGRFRCLDAGHLWKLAEGEVPTTVGAGSLFSRSVEREVNSSLMDLKKRRWMNRQRPPIASRGAAPGRLIERSFWIIKTACRKLTRFLIFRLYIFSNFTTARLQRGLKTLDQLMIQESKYGISNLFYSI